MKMTEIAQPRRWRVQNDSPRGGEIEIAGWAFGGNGPVALLHHANGMCAALWALVARQLTARYTVYAMDARGHGDSERLTVPEDYQWEYFISDLTGVARQLMDEHDEGHIGLGLGSSFGVIVTAAADAAAPGLFERIVMLDPPMHPEARLVEALDMGDALSPSSERAGLVEQTLRRRSVWPSREVARAAWQDKALFAAWRPEAFSLYLDEGMEDRADGTVALKCDPAVEAHIFASTGSLDVLDFAPRVQAAVSFVHAAQGFFPEIFFRRVATLFPHSEFVQLQGGHMLPLEVPELVVDLVLGL